MRLEQHSNAVISSLLFYLQMLRSQCGSKENYFMPYSKTGSRIKSVTLLAGSPGGFYGETVTPGIYTARKVIFGESAGQL